MTDGAIFLTILVTGHLDSYWSDWFSGLNMLHLANGNTELYGSVIDQAAVYGLLNRARDLGLTLVSVSVNSADPGQTGGV